MMQHIYLTSFLLLLANQADVAAADFLGSIKDLTTMIGEGTIRIKDDLMKPKEKVVEGFSALSSLWKNYYGLVPLHYNCSAYVAGNQTEIDSYIKKGRVQLKQSRFLLNRCNYVQQRVNIGGHQNRLVNPFAIARNVYSKPEQNEYYHQELLLTMSYSSSNLYCYALDKKSNEMFKTEMRKLNKCFKNVFVLEQEYDFNSSGHFQNHAHTDCSRELLKRAADWKYVLFLQNNDLVLKTSEEISDIISVLNGSSWIPFEKIKSVGELSAKYSPEELNLFKKESGFSEYELHKKLNVKKGSNQMLLPREFVEAVEQSLNLTIALDLFNAVENEADMFLYPTLIGAHHLRLPGHFESNCFDDNFRYAQKSKTEDGSDCKSRNSSNSRCLLGIESISELITGPHIIASNFSPDFDFGGMLCIAEALYAKGKNRYHIDLHLFQKLPQVREHHLKVNGKFDKCTFRCDTEPQFTFSELWSASTSKLCGVIKTILRD